MIGEALGLVGAAASGGVLGLIGTGIHALLKWGEQREKRKREIELRKLDLDELRLEGELNMQRAEKEIERARVVGENQLAAAEQQADQAIRVASYVSDKATYGGGWVDAVRGLMRPVITAYSLGLLTWIGWLMWQAGASDLAASSIYWRQVVEAVILLATTSATWWFGSRAMRTGGGRG